MTPLMTSGQRTCPSESLPQLQNLAGCLAHKDHFINICYVNSSDQIDLILIRRKPFLPDISKLLRLSTQFYCLFVFFIIIIWRLKLAQYLLWDPLLFVSGDESTGCETAGVTINKRSHWMQWGIRGFSHWQLYCFKIFLSNNLRFTRARKNYIYNYPKYTSHSVSTISPK